MRLWLGGLDLCKVKAEYGSLCDIKGMPYRQFFAGVACTWLQADQQSLNFPTGTGGGIAPHSTIPQS